MAAILDTHKVRVDVPSEEYHSISTSAIMRCECILAANQRHVSLTLPTLDMTR
jgi:hypothetical protein